MYFWRGSCVVQAQLKRVSGMAPARVKRRPSIVHASFWCTSSAAQSRPRHCALLARRIMPGQSQSARRPGALR
eukprot:6840052-Pyramimonas_sp.AAC.1